MMNEVQGRSLPLVLTLKLDQSTFDQVNWLRQQYFPPERNLVPAHVTLFHALPGDYAETIAYRLQRLCSCTAKISLDLPTLRFLGNGVAIEVVAPDLVQLRQTLADTWGNWLKAQDRQRYRPHITIQNKVSSSDARLTYEQLMQRWQGMSGYGEGLLLWFYRSGVWELANDVSFTAQIADSPP